MTNEQPAVNPDINVGNATIIGTEKGWMLPGRFETASRSLAYRVAERMAVLMQGYVREGK